jgi:hypothetical protein
MKNIPNKRELLTSLFQNVLAVELPSIDDTSDTIYLLFSDEQSVMAATFSLQDYKGTGFSILIEPVDQDRINLKLYEHDTDDFHVCKEVPVKTNAVSRYRQIINSSSTFLSVGMLDTFTHQIEKNRFLRVPLKSISIQ